MSIFGDVKIVQPVGATIGRPCRDDNFRQGKKTLRAAALAVPLFRSRPQPGGLALRAEFSSLSFPKEKETKKKENLRACALKNPPHCTDLLRSIKNGMLAFAAIAFWGKEKFI